MASYHPLHSLTSFLVKLYKWLELVFFKIFSTQVEYIIRRNYVPLGVKFVGPGANAKLKLNDEIIIQNCDENGNIKPFKKNKWDFEIHNPLFFSRVAAHASLGMGESYIEGWWDCDDIVELSYRIMKSGIYMEYLTPWNRFLNFIELGYFNLQSPARSWEVGKKHYDIGNDLFESFLDPWMNYSCAYWAKATTLEEAQLHKMELIAQKLKLKPGMRVLDIGCGWGGLCKYLAKHHGVSCVGITISKEGVKYAQDKSNDLPNEFRLMDYRDIKNETFDRVVSVGMFEHVGRNNYRAFFEVANKCLKDDGLLLLHTIGNNHSEIPGYEPFFHTYIFPNSCIPYYQDITKYSEDLYVLEDWHNFGHDYTKTLIAWRENFEKNWPAISHKYGERFYRMWTYYLQTAAGGFKARKIQLWQVVFSKKGVDGGYISVR